MNILQPLHIQPSQIKLTLSLGILCVVLVIVSVLHFLTFIDLAIPFHRMVITSILVSASLEPFIYLYQPKSIYLLGLSSFLLFGFWYFIISLFFIGEF